MKVEIDKPLLLFLFAASISLINYFYQLQYIVNIPYADDYILILGKYAEYQQADSAKETLAILFAPHNVHYTILINIVVGILAWLEAPVNFFWLSALGMLARLLSFWLVIFIISSIKMERRHLSLIAFCSALFFFQPKAWQATHFVTMTLYGNLPWLFGFLAIAVANSKALSFGKVCGAILLSLIAALAGTPGIPAIIFIALLVILRSSNSVYRVTACVSAAVICLTFAYLLSVSSHAEIDLGDSFQGASLLVRSVGLAGFFFQLLGGYWTTHEILATILGIAGFSLTCLLSVHFLLKKYFGVVILTLFSINASLMVSIGRYSANGSLAFEWRFFTFTEIYWLVLIVSSLAFASTIKYSVFKKVLPVASVIAMLYTYTSHVSNTTEMALFSKLQEREVVELAIGYDGLYEGFWLGPAFTELALKYAGSPSYSFEQSMSEYTKAESMSSCSDSKFKISPNDFDVIAGDQFDAAYVKLKAVLTGSEITNCHFLACDDSASFSFDATVNRDQSLEQHKNKKYIVTAVIDRKYQKSVNQLRCTTHP
jgi:hypothetical protein